jgi:hypothetical protein
MSKYTEKQSGDQHFFNEMRKVLSTFERKTALDYESINLAIADKAYNYLIGAAKKEFGDDYDMNTYYEDYINSFGKFGTVVEKTVRRKGKNIVKIVPFETFLCDPENGSKLPAGEVTASTIGEVLENDKYDIEVRNRLRANILEEMEEDYIPYKATVNLYEIHGKLPLNLFEKGGKGVVDGMFIVLQDESGDTYVLYSGRTSNVTYSINRLNRIFGRTMGYGPMEAMLETQMMTNKLGNATMDHLMATSKVVYQTADGELDGQDLQTIDNLTLISHETDSPITQVQASPQGYSAMSNFMSTVVSLGRESAAIQDASLGRGPKSNTSFASLQASAKEADGVYLNLQSKMFNKAVKTWKRKGGFIDMCVDYFESGKDIKDLLTPDNARGFMKMIARNKAEDEVQRQSDEGLIHVDDIKEVEAFILKRDAGKNFVIEYKEGEIDRDFIRDKMRLTYASQSDIISNKIARLQLVLDRVERNPEEYYEIDANNVLMEMLDLMDLADSHNIRIDAQQSNQIAPTPTGPNVAANNGLV